VPNGRSGSRRSAADVRSSFDHGEAGTSADALLDLVRVLLDQPGHSAADRPHRMEAARDAARFSFAWITVISARQLGLNPWSLGSTRRVG
jgi:hypothetical protein